MIPYSRLRCRVYPSENAFSFTDFCSSCYFWLWDSSAERKCPNPALDGGRWAGFSWRIFCSNLGARQRMEVPN